uniref:Reverse transcriptase domain, reverse transcriptase zinc-binding domain protein n=1 Tax=Tanacetum cinerariifolium TaxID=118510 RepID=A0A6L2MK93_TANCI|nr:reverse transcriptase domain, reverse transcriptase zinc-binding domain protein [Tanacetum cinerariifolium]
MVFYGVKGKAKFAWVSVCMPKHEGGLGIRRIDDFNVALMATHIWSILTHIESLWVKWVHTVKLKGRSLWDVSCRGNKLKIQDRLWQWDAGLSIDLNLLRCPLCDLVPDSHDHLFFECAFSSHVWSKVRVLGGMDSIPPRIIDVTNFINPISKSNTTVSILSRRVLAATSYYVWLERNGRLFKKKTLTSDQIVDVIISMVRLKLVAFKFKKMSTRSRLLLDQWKIPSYCIVHDGSTRRRLYSFFLV